MTPTPTTCIFCPYALAPGDKIACREHRKKLDATRMPWEPPDEQPRLIEEDA